MPNLNNYHRNCLFTAAILLSGFTTVFLYSTGIDPDHEMILVAFAFVQFFTGLVTTLFIIICFTGFFRNRFGWIFSIFVSINLSLAACDLFLLVMEKGMGKPVLLILLGINGIFSFISWKLSPSLYRAENRTYQRRQSS